MWSILRHQPLKMSDPLYTALDAVADGAFSMVDGAVWTTLGGPIAAQTVLDDIVAGFRSDGPFI